MLKLTVTLTFDVTDEAQFSEVAIAAMEADLPAAFAEEAETGACFGADGLKLRGARALFTTESGAVVADMRAGAAVDEGRVQDTLLTALVGDAASTKARRP